jgi:hypothetical protein
MLTGKWQVRLIMIKGINTLVKMPAFRTVAYVAAQLEILTMRMTFYLPEKEEYAADKH